jgi:uncharacterized protein
MPLQTAQEIIALLGLSPHPEGGFYRETYRSSRIGEFVFGERRAASTAIYFLLLAGEPSCFHRIAPDEAWHYYAGAPAMLHLLDPVRGYRQWLLGSDLAVGQRPQWVVEGGCWQAAETTGEWTLIGCTVAPAFQFADFQLADRRFLRESFPDWSDPIDRLTTPR